MGLEFKEAFSSFLHQYFHTNANFWNSVKISGNFKVAVDEYQEDYLFSEVITKTDCCCSSNLLDKLTTPITIRGTGQPQAPIIIKEEPNESNRSTLISDDVTITNSSIITTPNTSTTPTISSSSPSPNNTCVTIIDKTTDCAGSEAQPIETEKTYTAVLSPDPTYTIPPRPSRWYISNCQPQVTDIDGRTIIPSLLVTTAPTVSSSPSKITDMLQITSCEGDEEAAALQTFSSAQEHDHIETEDTVTLQGTTAFTTEAQVADLQLTYASQVEKTLTAITPLTTACPHNSSSNDSIASNNDRPQAGFVNKETADKYSMKELLPGSSIYMYDEQIDGVRKRAYDKKGKIDGRRMARQLMNIFFKKNELINCSISSSPAAGKTQLNPVLVNSIISYCQVNSTTLKSAIKDAMWSKITSANAKFAKKMKIQQIQQPIQR